MFSQFYVEFTFWHLSVNEDDDDDDDDGLIVIISLY